MYKNILNKINRKNSLNLKHILKEFLTSYKSYRKYLEFHGNINQSSVVPSIPNKFDTNTTLESDEIMRIKFNLSYNHTNMLTVKEWIHFRLNRLKKNSK